MANVLRLRIWLRKSTKARECSTTYSIVHHLLMHSLSSSSFVLLLLLPALLIPIHPRTTTKDEHENEEAPPLSAILRSVPSTTPSKREHTVPPFRPIHRL